MSSNAPDIPPPHLSEDEFFAWLRTQQPDNRLIQDNVDAAKTLLAVIPPPYLQDLLIRMGLAEPAILLIPNPNPPKATRADIYAAARRIQVEPAMIKALSDVESPKGGFNADGTPKILFERHKMWSGLTRIKWFTKRNELSKKHPDICSESSGSYNTRPQYDKLLIAATLNWDVAHESASWGFGQVMGFNWKKLGYESILDFVTRMYKSEGEQLDAVCRYIQVTGLDSALRAKNWAVFAAGYNGKDYRINDYDNKMARAYAKAKKDGY